MKCKSLFIFSYPSGNGYNKISTDKRMVDPNALTEYVKWNQSGYVSKWSVKTHKMGYGACLPGSITYSLMIRHRR